MRPVQKIVLMLAATFAAGLLFVNVYTSVVDAPNWGRDIPASLEAARTYFKVANPGTFFRVASPAYQILSLLALVLCWRAGKTVRICLALALVLGVAADVMTFAYFYPRNDIMFVAPLDPNIDALKAAWSGWTSMNWLRSTIIALGLVLDFAALSRVSNPNSDRTYREFRR